jgi:iron complex transport system ATP-binding protein
VSEAPSAVSLRDLEFGYESGRAVFSGVNAELGAGRFCALIGPNGAGKTTLLKLLLGVLQPRRGEVRVAGELVARLRPGRRAALVAYVPQRSAATFAFSVEEVAAMGRFALEADGGALEAALAACEVESLRSKPFSELSVGEQQRVLLARAMAQAAGEGKVLLLDEPVSAMDLAHVHRTLARLRGLVVRGLAVLVVLQDLNLAARYADDVWLLAGGRLAAAGTWREVLRPEVLEPAYGVRLRVLAHGGAQGPGISGEARPIFDVAAPME